MIRTHFLSLLVALQVSVPAIAQEVLDESQASDALQRLGGCWVYRDENIPGQPVVKVVLQMSAFRDADVALLQQFKDLQTLDMFWCHNVTDAGVAQISTLQNLKTLKLSSKNFSLTSKT
jgi:hypothetical protein